MDLLEEFLQSENAKVNWWNRLTGNYSEVIRTSMLVGDVRTPKKPEKVLRPAIVPRLLGIVALTGGLFGWIMSFGGLIRGREPWWLVFFFLVYISACVGAGNLFFSKKYNFKLRFNRSGIMIDGHLVPWDDMVETVILFKPGGRQVLILYLVLFLRDGSTRVLDMRMFVIQEKRLSTIVEQYKLLAKN